MPWADAACPSLAAGLFLTRIGCYLFGCDFGKPLTADAPGWLKKIGTFPHWEDGTVPHGTGSPAWLHHLQHNLVASDSAASLPVHPTQVYESAIGLGLLGVLLLVRKHQKFRGQVFLTFTFLYAVLRFLLEMLRDDPERNKFGPQLAEHLFISGVLALFGLAFALFIAQSVSDAILRRLTQVAVMVPAVVAFLLLRPATFGDEALIQLSTSQWIGVLTGVPAAVFFAVFWKTAVMHPEGAMTLRLEEHFARQAELAAEPKGAKEAKAGAAASGKSDEDEDEDEADEANNERTEKPTGGATADALPTTNADGAPRRPEIGSESAVRESPAPAQGDDKR